MHARTPSGFAALFGEGYRRRLAIAVAVAIAIHEIIAALIPGRFAPQPPPPETERITIAKLVRIEHRATPTPRPTPKPTVPPKIIAPMHTAAPVINPGNVGVRHKVQRPAAARPLVRTHFHSRPIQHIVMGGQGTGESLRATAVTGGGTGAHGSGSGSGGTGEGSGGEAAANEPCGFVEFVDTEQHADGDGGFTERVRMIVHFPNKTSADVDLDYPWHYASSAEDPWSDENLKNPAFEKGIPFQFPPAGQRASEPPLVQYVMTHTSGSGVTRLKECA